MTTKETLDKAYGNVPKEVGLNVDWDWFPTWRGVKYYYYKMLRRLTRQ
jgi:hypothetical protein